MCDKKFLVVFCPSYLIPDPRNATVQTDRNIERETHRQTEKKRQRERETESQRTREDGHGEVGVQFGKCE